MNSNKPKRRLSLRTRLFVEAYLSNGGNVAKATREAGYAPDHAIGHRRLSDPAVRALIKRRLDSIGLNREEVIGSLVMIMREHTNSSDPAVAANALLAATELCKIFGLGNVRRPTPKEKQMRDSFREWIGQYDQKD
jgi:hypothetical protein